MPHGAVASAMNSADSNQQIVTTLWHCDSDCQNACANHLGEMYRICQMAGTTNGHVMYLSCMVAKPVRMPTRRVVFSSTAGAHRLRRHTDQLSGWCWCKLKVHCVGHSFTLRFTSQHGLTRMYTVHEGLFCRCQQWKSCSKLNMDVSHVQSTTLPLKAFRAC